MTRSSQENLFHAWLDGTATQEQFAELERLLAADSRVARQFALRVAIHHHLRESLVAKGAFASVSHCFGHPDEPVRMVGKLSRITSKLLLATLLGLPLLILLLFCIHRPASKTPKVVQVDLQLPLIPYDSTTNSGSQPASSIAPAVQRAVARIEMGSANSNSRYWGGDYVYVGDRVRIGNGSISLRFLIGATVILDGPADLEIIEHQRATLHYGRATATVDESAHGFTIETPTADIVDLGTKFGVKVEKGAPSEVVVFEGGVNVNGRNPSPPHRPFIRYLHAGEAVRIDETGNFSRIFGIWRRPTGTGWVTDYRDSANSLVQSLRDNLSSTERPKYYSIHPAGFRAGVLGYVDRLTYEWWGIDGTDVPPELKSGDYIQTYNSDKKSEHLTIWMQISRPAKIYILYDDRAPVAPWLERSFEKTVMVVVLKDNLDRAISRDQMAVIDREANIPHYNSRMRNQVRDLSFSVWRREVTQPGEVVLGGIPHGAGWSVSMYGIVVKPNSSEIN